ncbi:MAG TPA: CHAT domain-containing protein [Trichocoleus sp.]
MTQEFHISVTPVGNEEYLVRTERVAPGVPLAEEQLMLPVEAWLAQARQLMSDPLLGLLQGDRPLGNQNYVPNPTHPDVLQPPLSLVELGQELYSHLFQGTLRDSWVTAQGVAQNRRQALRLRLGLKGNRLPRLPWEVLYGTDVPIDRFRQQGNLMVAPRPLATGIHVIFSRYRPSTRLAEEGVPLTTEPDQPLRILMIISAPSDQEQLQLYQEATQLQQELRVQPHSTEERLAGCPCDIQLTILNQPGREELTQALEQGQFQVLHYAGHSDLSSGGGCLYLVNNRTGLTEILSGDDLAGLLVNNDIRFAVFNSCRSSYSAVADAEPDRNLAEALMSRGIPAVLAMAEQIPDEVSLSLTRLFYRNLKQGYPIDLSLSRARQGLISSYGSNQLYWALPVLYIHPEFDGYLTPGDRSQDDPADRLLFTPPTYELFPLPPGEAAIFPPALNTEARLVDPDEANRIAEEMWSDDDDWIELTEDDEDERAVVDLIRQLVPPTSQPASPPIANEPPPVPAAGSMALVLQDRGGIASGTPGQPASAITPPEGQSSSGASRPSSTRRTAVRPRSRPRLLPLMGIAAGTLTLALFGSWVLPKLISHHSDGSNNPSIVNGSQPQPPELASRSTSELKQMAIDNFGKNRYAKGLQAAEALLDRGALPETEAALAAIPIDRQNDAETYFLKGRLNWQGAKQGNGQYSVATARQQWEKAVAAEPDQPLYYEAIGFSQYAQGQPQQAIQSWVRALSIAEQSSPAREASTAASNMDKDTLTAYAGVALGLWKASTDPNASQQGDLLSKAVKIYQMVQTSDPSSFQPTNLTQNWLWTEAAIQDWKTLAESSPDSSN